MKLVSETMNCMAVFCHSPGEGGGGGGTLKVTPSHIEPAQLLQKKYLLEKLIQPKAPDCQTHKNRSIITILKREL